MAKIKIKIKDKEEELTLDEARELFNELNSIFGEKTVTIPHAYPYIDTSSPKPVYPLPTFYC